MIDPEEFNLGFSVAPNPNCPHISSPAFHFHEKLLVSSSGAQGKAPRRNLFTDNCVCETCGDAEETWVCLRCSFSGCSRYKSGHMVAHVTDETHDHKNAAISISLSDLSTWCFSCDDYITHPKLEPIFREFHKGKFGVFPSSQLHAEDTGGVPVVLEVKEKTEEKDANQKS